MRIWIVRQYTDPLSHYVLWSEKQAREMMEGKPDSGWGKMELYVGEVERADQQDVPPPHSLTPIVEWWASQWTSRLPGFNAAEGLFWGFLIGAVIFVALLLYSALF